MSVARTTKHLQGSRGVALRQKEVGLQSLFMVLGIVPKADTSLRRRHSAEPNRLPQVCRKSSIDDLVEGLDKVICKMCTLLALTSTILGRRWDVALHACDLGRVRHTTSLVGSNYGRSLGLLLNLDNCTI